MKIYKKLQKQFGFSLLEVLVAVFVFSIGMLGLAGMQLTALKNTNSAHFRTIAMILANDISDKIRANPVIDTADPNAYKYVSGTKPNATAACESTAGCTATQMADTDLRNWIDLVETSLPNATARICRDNDPDVMKPGDTAPPSVNCTDDGTHPYVVYIDWLDEKDTIDGGAPLTKRFAMSF